MIKLDNGLVVSDRLFKFLSNVERHIGSKLFLKTSRSQTFYGSVNYIDIEDSKFSYIDIKKYPNIKASEAYFVEHKSKRIEVAPGRIFSKLFVDEVLKSNMTNSDIEVFTNYVKSYFGPPLTIKVVSGEELRKYYKESTYARGSGSLNKSCMRYDSCQEYLDLYVDHCKMVIGLDSDGKLAARALIWENVIAENLNTKKNKNNKKFLIKLMDRVYTTFDKDVISLTEWAKENGYAYKAYQTHHNKCDVVVDGVQKNLRLSLSIPNFKSYNKYPYLDTFSFNLGDTNIISSSSYSHDSIETEFKSRYYSSHLFLCDTHGRYSEQNEYWEVTQIYNGILKFPKQNINKDYNKFIEWINEYYGFDYPIMDLGIIEEYNNKMSVVAPIISQIQNENENTDFQSENENTGSNDTNEHEINSDLTEQIIDIDILTTSEALSDFRRIFTANFVER